MRVTVKNLHGCVFVILIRFVEWLKMRGEACQKCLFSAFCEATVFVIEFMKHYMARTNKLNPSHEQ